MKVSYSDTALAEVEDIFAYIATDSPAAAARVVKAVEAVIERLAIFPLSAVGTEVRGVRVAPLRRYPYLIFYSIEGDTLFIRNIRHGARRRPAFTQS